VVLPPTLDVMSQYPGYRAPGPHGAPQFGPPGNQPTAPIPTGPIPTNPFPINQVPYGYRGDLYGGPPHPPAPNPPAPSPPWPVTGTPYGPPVRRQRPAVIAMAATMTVTASLQWLCALSLAWLVATAGAASLSTNDAEGAFYHILRRFHLRMIEGLALPLYGFPTLAFFLGFVVLAPRTWARLALTLTGVASLAWSAWWLRNDILWWLPIATYVGIVCLILWTPGATQWYRQRAT
jgi:hypothetical protein